MSDILADIDDTLADWNGSADSMRWRPGGAEDAGATHTLIGANGFMATVRDVVLTTTSTLPPMEDPDDWMYQTPLTSTTFEIRLGYWQTAAMRRQIAAAFDITPRLLGLPPRYGFDARYRQRQKNRRKRRR